MSKCKKSLGKVATSGNPHHSFAIQITSSLILNEDAKDLGMLEQAPTCHNLHKGSGSNKFFKALTKKGIVYSCLTFTRIWKDQPKKANVLNATISCLHFNQLSLA